MVNQKRYVKSVIIYVHHNQSFYTPRLYIVTCCSIFSAYKIYCAIASNRPMIYVIIRYFELGFFLKSTRASPSTPLRSFTFEKRYDNIGGNLISVKKKNEKKKAINTIPRRNVLLTSFFPRHK